MIVVTNADAIFKASLTAMQEHIEGRCNESDIEKIYRCKIRESELWKFELVFENDEDATLFLLRYA